jgi:hypothetical protein
MAHSVVTSPFFHILLSLCHQQCVKVVNSIVFGYIDWTPIRSHVRSDKGTEIVCLFYTKDWQPISSSIIKDPSWSVVKNNELQWNHVSSNYLAAQRAIP